MIGLTRCGHTRPSRSTHRCFSARMRRHTLGRNLCRDSHPTMHTRFSNPRGFARVHLDGECARQRRPSIGHPCVPQRGHDGRMGGKYRQRDGSQRFAGACGLQHADRRRRIRGGRRDAVCARDHAAAFAPASGIGRNRDMHGGLSLRGIIAMSNGKKHADACNALPAADRSRHASICNRAPVAVRATPVAPVSIWINEATPLAAHRTVMFRNTPPAAVPERNTRGSSAPRRACRRGAHNRPLRLARQGARLNGMRFA